MKKWLKLFFCSLFLLLWMGGCATQKQLPLLSLTQHGTLPQSGRVIIRSGLQWMPENAPLFQRLSASLAPLLEQRGLTLVSGPPTVMPPLPGSSTSQAGSVVSRHSTPSRTGQHTPLRLDSYAVPQKDADLPSSVMRIQPIDADTVLFALSQQKGIPVLPLGAALPAYLPSEIHTKDSQRADFVIVCRFAVQGSHNRTLSFITPPQHSYTPSSYIAGLLQNAQDIDNISGVAVAAARMPMTAGSIRGVNTLGYGSAAPAARPQPAYGGTPGDYARGYEGMTNTGDPWHREHDMNARDYTLRHGEPPSYASPPQTDGATSSSAVVASPNLPSLPRAPLPGEGTAPQHGGKNTTLTALSGTGQGQGSTTTPDAVILLEIACYSLAPVRQGRRPELVWQGSARQTSPENTLMQELPRMVQQLLQKNL